MKGAIVLTFFAVFLLHKFCVADDCYKTPFYRYWKPGHNHFYTIDSKEIGTTVSGEQGNHGYLSEGTVCSIYKL